MTTMPTMINSLPISFKPIVDPYLTPAGSEYTDTLREGVNLPVFITTPPVSSNYKPKCDISEHLLSQTGCSEASPSSSENCQVDIVPPLPVVHSTALSFTAEEFSPSNPLPLPDTRPYPPGFAQDGVEWSESEDAWMALEYGKHDTKVFQTKNAAVPDLEDISGLRTLEVKLPCGGIFDDKLLPPPVSKVVPHVQFSKEYFIDLHLEVRKHGTYNYAGAKIKLQHSKLNIEMFRECLKDYDDIGIISYLEYGFPVGLSQQIFLEPLTKNHSSAYQYYSSIDSFLSKGILHAECTGPFQAAPMNPLMTSPMMTAEKAPNLRRTVFDASFGNFSLNQNTPEKEYLGEEYQFKFPSVLDLADLVVKLGRGCLLYKRDLSRWFLQLPIDPGDYDKLGFVWRGKF